MTWQADPYIIALLGGAVVAGLVAVAAWKRPSAAGSRNLAFLMAAVFEWSLMAAFEASAYAVSVKIFWSKIEYIGIAASPVLLFLFALKFSRPDVRIPSGKRVLLWTVPVVTFLLAVTNNRHHLIWSGLSSAPGSHIHLLIYQHGPFFWVHAVYSYALMVITTILLLKSYFRSRDMQRRQALALLGALPWPYLGNILYLSGLTASTGHDYTSLGFAVTGTCLLWAIYRLRLIELVPFAREKVTESMSECLIVLDANARIAALNAAARTILSVICGGSGPIPASKVLGKPAAEVYAGWPALAESLAFPSLGQRELVWRKGDQTRFYDLRMSPVPAGGGQAAGWVAVLYDISQLKKAEAQASEAFIVAETLRDAGVKLSSALEFREMSDLILGLIQRVIAFDAGAFLSVEGSELRLAGVLRVGDGAAMIGSSFPITGCRLCNMVIQQGRPRIIEGIGPEDILLPMPPDIDVRSYLGVPIIFRDQVTGLLALYGRREGQFTNHDLWVAELFARQVGIALQNSRLFEQVNALAVTDNLTGLLNRRRFFELAEKEFERARRYKRALALILFDIDRFKSVNDGHGHLIGDQVLRTMASTVSKAIRTSDLICRYGGDEFLLLMPEAGRDQALGMAERLRQKTSEMVIVTAGGQLHLTISAGVAVLLREADETLEKLVARADAAMYEAKAAGRDKISG